MTLRIRRALVVAAVLGVQSVALPARAVDARVDAAAKRALRKAAHDYLVMRYAAGAKRLEKALRACGDSECASATKAALIRDIGTMQFREGNKDGAAAAFSAAVAIQADIDLNRDYEAPDLRAAWTEATRPATVSAKPARQAHPPESSATAPGERGEDERTTGAGEDEDTDEETATPAKSAAPSGDGGHYATWWIGISGALDFVSLPADNDACVLTPGGAPANASGYYCTDSQGNDFPSHADTAQNSALVRGQTGAVGGGIQPGDFRVMLAVDYAVSPSFLIGGRIGYVGNTYTGSAAIADSHAFSYPVHVEARATYLFGPAPLASIGFSPMVFVAAGVSEFDGHTTTLVSQNDIAGQEPVSAWRVDAPWFLAIGGGTRYQFSERAAFTAALRLNAALGAAGVLPTTGPEIGFQYGF